MRIADPFIMIIHVSGSLPVIHDFGPTPGLIFQGVANALRISGTGESSVRLCAAPEA